MSSPVQPPLTVETIDGATVGRPITKIKVTNGTLAVSGSTATLTISGGGGGTENNVGGGGGGGNHAAWYTAAAAGGSGVVILRMSDDNYSGTTSGSPTVDTSTVADETILIFNGSGSYTA